MSFLDEITTLTSAAPTLDPELAELNDSSVFLSAKSSARPYHIQDDAESGAPASRREVFGEEALSAVDGEAVRMLEEALGSEEAEESGSEDVSSEEESGEGYETGDSEDKEELKLVHQPSPAADTAKRAAVRSQLACWDKLVQLRLKLQPSLQHISRLPPPDKRLKLMSGDEAQTHRHKIISNIQASLDRLLDLQERLGERGGREEEELTSEEEEAQEVKPKRKRKQKSGFYADVLRENGEKFEKFKSSTISHWYEQTKVVAKKASFMNKEVTVMDQIEHILSNKDRLIERTQQNRNSVKFFRNPESEFESHPYIFNDDDFYQQLLREIIDKKMGNCDKSDPEAMGRQWVELQSLKVKTKKKNVDTKASKGRKIRYDVHSKLLGFMAPVAMDTLSDTRQDELFKSLFASNL